MFEDLKHNDVNMSAYGFDVENTISEKINYHVMSKTYKSNTNFFKKKIIILCLGLLWGSLDIITIFLANNAYRANFGHKSWREIT